MHRKRLACPERPEFVQLGALCFGSRGSGGQHASASTELKSLNINDLHCGPKNPVGSIPIMPPATVLEYCSSCGGSTGNVTASAPNAGSLLSRQSLFMRLSIAEVCRGMKCREKVGLIPHDQMCGTRPKSLSQIAPIGPFLPTRHTRTSGRSLCGARSLVRGNAPSTIRILWLGDFAQNPTPAVNKMPVSQDGA